MKEIKANLTEAQKLIDNLRVELQEERARGSNLTRIYKVNII